MSWILLCLALALAQDDTASSPGEAAPATDEEPVEAVPATDEEPAEADDEPDDQADDEPDPDEEGVDEVVVVRGYGPDALRKAREAIADRMGELGWEQVGTRDGALVFRGPESWMGRAILQRDGLMRFTRPVLAVDGAEGMRTSDPGTADPDTPIAEDAPGGDYQGISRDPGSGAAAGVRFNVLPSKKKLDAVQGEVLEEVQPQLDAYRGVIQETAFQHTLTDLPDRLDALWNHGVPLEGGGARIDSEAERRRVLLDHWASRADTPQGHKVQERIEVYLAEVVQTSGHPVTPAEQREANQRSATGRSLDLPMP